MSEIPRSLAFNFKNWVAEAVVIPMASRHGTVVADPVRSHFRNLMLVEAEDLTESSERLRRMI